ncbi:hypothetical protein C8F04DRAFT_1182336 [Mycena alexandri]|uniref:Uncharacterized protein n=1 Tax=Mycena alexandri TaxID=1745969 RepID=A0AAD6SX33_9AGAR|nr:hypothetical protein C8F04DRAFT_1182336 [Mycena alexandri]
MGKRKRARVPKEDRQNLRNWAEGARETILTPHLERYADAFELGWRFEREVHRQICNEYHALVSWRLKDHEEPVLPLPFFDPNAPLPPDEKLSYEETQRREKRITSLNKRIRRWLKYRVTKLRKHVRTKVGSPTNPWSVLLAQLSKIHPPPKARQAYQQFMRESYATAIEPTVRARWAQTAAPGASVPTQEPPVDFRAKIARELFDALPQDVKDGYGARAKGESLAAREAFQKAMKEPPSTAPKDRQLAIDNLGLFLAPILRGIHERTGLHSVIILGGPMPEYGGDLRTVHVSYGRNRTAMASHFPQWAKERFNPVLSLMKEYLESAFNTDNHLPAAQDRLDAALPRSGALDGGKFTISPSAAAGSDSDSDDAASDSDGSDSDSSDESELEEAGRPRKKPKAAAKRASQVLSPIGNTSKKASKTAAGGTKAKGRLRKATAPSTPGQPTSGFAPAPTPTDGDAPGQSTSGFAPAPTPTDGDAPGQSTSGFAPAPTPTDGDAPGQSTSGFAPAPAPTDADTMMTSFTQIPPFWSTSGGAGPSNMVGAVPNAFSATPGAPLMFGSVPNVFSTLDGALGSLGGVGTIDPSSATINPVFLTLPSKLSTTSPPPDLTADRNADNNSNAGNNGDTDMPIDPVLLSADLASAAASGGLTIPNPASSARATSASTAGMGETPADDASSPPALNPTPPAPSAGATSPSTAGMGEAPADDASSPPALNPTPPAPSAGATSPSTAGMGEAPADDPPPTSFTGGRFERLEFPEAARLSQCLLPDRPRLPLPIGFTDAPRIAVVKTLRPKEVTTWVGAHRGTRMKADKIYDAGIANIAAYAQAWGTWWDSLQPEWRKRHSNGGWKTYEAYQPKWDWGSLASQGPNAGITLVAGLYFWGRAGSVKGEEWEAGNKAEWEAAIHDAQDYQEAQVKAWGVKSSLELSIYTCKILGISKEGLHRARWRHIKIIFFESYEEAAEKGLHTGKSRDGRLPQGAINGAKIGIRSAEGAEGRGGADSQKSAKWTGGAGKSAGGGRSWLQEGSNKIREGLRYEGARGGTKQVGAVITHFQDSCIVLDPGGPNIGQIQGIPEGKNRPAALRGAKKATLARDRLARGFQPSNQMATAVHFCLYITATAHVRDVFLFIAADLPLGRWHCGSSFRRFFNLSSWDEIKKEMSRYGRSWSRIM